MARFITSLTLILSVLPAGAAERRVPSIDDLLNLKSIGGAQIVYKGFGHGITKPRAQRAVMQHDLAFFNHYIWGDPRPDFVSPPLPKTSKSDGTR